MKRMCKFVGMVLLAFALVLSVACAPAQDGPTDGTDGGTGIVTPTPDDPGTDEPGTDEPGTDDPGTGEPSDGSPIPFWQIWEDGVLALDEQEYVTLDFTWSGQAVEDGYVFPLSAVNLFARFDRDEQYGYHMDAVATENGRSNRLLYIGGEAYSGVTLGDTLYYEPATGQTAEESGGAIEACFLMAETAAVLPDAVMAVFPEEELPFITYEEETEGGVTEQTITIGAEAFLDWAEEIFHRLDGLPLSLWKADLDALFAEDILFADFVGQLDKMLTSLDIDLEALCSDTILSSVLFFAEANHDIEETIAALRDPVGYLYEGLSQSRAFASIVDEPQAGEGLLDYLLRNFGSYAAADLLDRWYGREGYGADLFGQIREEAAWWAEEQYTALDLLDMLWHEYTHDDYTLLETIAMLDLGDSEVVIESTFTGGLLTRAALKADIYGTFEEPDGRISRYQLQIDSSCRLSYEEFALRAPTKEQLLPSVGEVQVDGSKIFLPVEWNCASPEEISLQIYNIDLRAYSDSGYAMGGDWLYDIGSPGLQWTAEEDGFSIDLVDHLDAMVALCEFSPGELKWAAFYELSFDMYAYLTVGDDGLYLDGWYFDAVSIEADGSAQPQFGEITEVEEGVLLLPVEWNGYSSEDFDVGRNIHADVYDENGDLIDSNVYVSGLDPVEQTEDGYRLDIRPLLEDPASYIDIDPSLSEQATWYDFEIDFFARAYEEGEDYWETIKIYEDTYDLDLKADGSILPTLVGNEAQFSEDGSIFIPVEWNDARPGELVLLLRAGGATLTGTQFVPGGENWEGYRSYWFDPAEGGSIAVSLEAGEDGYRGSVSACIDALLEGFAQDGGSLPGEGFDMRNVFLSFSFAEVGEDGSAYLFGNECSIGSFDYAADGTVTIR
ncbi:MAG TPA: hypothetical protein H9851_07010 [Candidatus Borkfalkia faecavium]|uniref:Uncharacterized protein n=2 Tax=Candidatus Borkfalkia TaxID=2508948 RepID=A0A9D2AV39_9FIRM|nr:hypothetical protein [Candidatus Borkfalkia faecigallinarum]HIX51008.1 hypothetical protein [Candidatus Borkfalkia faecavium]